MSFDAINYTKDGLHKNPDKIGENNHIQEKIAPKRYSLLHFLHIVYKDTREVNGIIDNVNKIMQEKQKDLEKRKSESPHMAPQFAKEQRLLGQALQMVEASKGQSWSEQLNAIEKAAKGAGNETGTQVARCIADALLDTKKQALVAWKKKFDAYSEKMEMLCQSHQFVKDGEFSITEMKKYKKLVKMVNAALDEGLAHNASVPAYNAFFPDTPLQELRLPEKLDLLKIKDVSHGNSGVPSMKKALAAFALFALANVANALPIDNTLTDYRSKLAQGNRDGFPSGSAYLPQDIQTAAFWENMTRRYHTYHHPTSAEASTLAETSLSTEIFASTLAETSPSPSSPEISTPTPTSPSKETLMPTEQPGDRIDKNRQRDLALGLGIGIPGGVGLGLVAFYRYWRQKRRDTNDKESQKNKGIEEVKHVSHEQDSVRSKIPPNDSGAKVSLNPVARQPGSQLDLPYGQEQINQSEEKFSARPKRLENFRELENYPQLKDAVEAAKKTLQDAELARNSEKCPRKYFDICVRALEYSFLDIGQYIRTGLITNEGISEELKNLTKHHKELQKALTILKFREEVVNIEGVLKKYNRSGSILDDFDALSRIHWGKIAEDRAKKISGDKITGKELTEYCEDYCKKLDKHALDLVSADTTTVWIRRGVGKLEEILKIGRVLSMFETETAGGKIVGTDGQARVEKGLFGYPLNLLPELRPLYGTISNDPNADPADKIVRRFGSIAIRLKQAVFRERASKIMYDSYPLVANSNFDGRQVLAALPVPFNKPGRNCFPLTDSKDSGDVNTPSDKDPLEFSHIDAIEPWAEAQIHAGVTIDDIEEVLFTKAIKGALRIDVDKAAGDEWKANLEALLCMSSGTATELIEKVGFTKAICKYLENIPDEQQKNALKNLLGRWKQELEGQVNMRITKLTQLLDEREIPYRFEKRGTQYDQNLDMNWVHNGQLAVGGSFEKEDINDLSAMGIKHVVDTRAENWDDSEDLKQENIQILSLPVRDEMPLSLQQLRKGVAWVQERLDRNEGVYIHCEYGKGRSAMFACAVLMVMGQGMGAYKAMEFLKYKRPQMSLTNLQEQRLYEFERELRGGSA